MNPVEYLSSNYELRAVFRFFRERPGCTGITWFVDNGTAVQLGDALGHFTFEDGEPVLIVAPATGTLVRTFNPSVAELPSRPSAPIAVFNLAVATDSTH